MTRAAKLADLRDHPEKHRHTFDELQACCWDGEALDLDLMQRHEGLGAGPRCDVVEGQCSCGSMHVREKDIVTRVGELADDDEPPRSACGLCGADLILGPLGFYPCECQS